MRLAQELEASGPDSLPAAAPWSGCRSGAGCPTGAGGCMRLRCGRRPLDRRLLPSRWCWFPLRGPASVARFFPRFSNDGQPRLLVLTIAVVGLGAPPPFPDPLVALPDAIRLRP